MKIKYLLIEAMLVPSLVVLFSCSDNDDPTPVVDEPQPNEITFSTDGAQVQIGGADVLVPIIDGAGEYTAYSLNPEIAEVYKGNDENYYITGVKNGRTEIMVADAANQFKRFPVSVYTTPAVELSANAVRIVTVLGKRSENGEVLISFGNGDYSVESDNEDVTVELVNAADSRTDTESSLSLAISALGRNNPYTATITVTDVSGFYSTLSVNVESDKVPFSQDELDTLDDLAVSDAFIDCYPEQRQNKAEYWFFSTDPSYDTGEWFDSDANGVHTFGWWWAFSELSECGHLVKYPAGTNVGEEVAGTYIWSYTTEAESGYLKQTLTGRLKVLRNDDNRTVVIWWNIDEVHEYLEKGYIVKVN